MKLDIPDKLDIEIREAHYGLDVDALLAEMERLGGGFTNRIDVDDPGALEAHTENLRTLARWIEANAASVNGSPAMTLGKSDAFRISAVSKIVMAAREALGLAEKKLPAEPFSPITGPALTST
jgi:hypothetical protein